MASNRPKLPIVVPKDGFYFPPEAGLPATPRLAGYPTTPRSATVPRSATAGSEYPFPAAKPLASRPTGKTDLYDESVRSSTAVQRNIARFRTTGFGRFLTRVGTSTSDFMYRVSPAPSWRSSVLMFAGSASVVFCLNLAFTIWTLTMLPEGSNFVDGIGVFAEGDCSYIRSANIVVHLLINVLSTILLAGSNFCMQVLSAPTRREVDEAHARGRWLDIGVPSLRNWASVSWMSRFLWFLLGVSSIPLHFFYNSTLFASTSVNLYDVFLVSSPSLAAATAALRSPERIPPDTGDSDLDLMLNLFAAGQLIPLSPQDCFRAYSRPFQSTHSSLLLVTPDQQVGEPARRVVSAPRPGSPEREIQASLDFACGRRPAYQWVCSQFPTAAPPNPSFDNVNTGGLFSGNLSRLATSSTQNGACPAPCDDFLAAISANVTSQWRPFNVSSVSSCHARASRERCKLMFSPLLSVIVTILNLLKAGLMFAVAWRRTEPPLLTVGDAIASFLETTDYVSKAAGCLLDRREAMARDRRRRRRFWRRIWNRFRGVRERNPREEMEEEEAEAGWGDPKQFVDNRPPRFNAASFRRWFATMFL